jgi:hypothetical protein
MLGTVPMQHSHRYYLWSASEPERLTQSKGFMINVIKRSTSSSSSSCYQSSHSINAIDPARHHANCMPTTAKHTLYAHRAAVAVPISRCMQKEHCSTTTAAAAQQGLQLKLSKACSSSNKPTEYRRAAIDDQPPCTEEPTQKYSILHALLLECSTKSLDHLQVAAKLHCLTERTQLSAELRCCTGCRLFYCLQVPGLKRHPARALQQCQRQTAGRRASQQRPS